MKFIKILISIAVVVAMLTVSILPAFAAGDVSSAIQSTWNSAQTQIKNVVNNVVFPAVDMILAILFFVKLATAYMDYRKHGQFEFTAPAILFGCLVFSLTAPLYIWTVL
ncbi:MAG: DUF3852 domain-containing protein [Ruminococcus sp.]|uniref:DUF3852 domain-containing protein n=1 Tax=Ruminococcus bromii TaxID=40518 RepID=UPI00241EC502|nr:MULTISPECIES: DUF3852 domain-containing protein [Ruminococcus]MBS6811115.1 DUF3852 domain-containing protein [Ruminococcus sp.]MEE0609768.1 DUF3852 domain-containing protein [Ruminococcus bromii]